MLKKQNHTESSPTKMMDFNGAWKKRGDPVTLAYLWRIRALRFWKCYPIDLGAIAKKGETTDAENTEQSTEIIPGEE